MEEISFNQKQCPICKDIISSEIFNDHLICHQIENEENNNPPDNININPNNNSTNESNNNNYYNNQNNQNNSENNFNNNQNGFLTKINDFISSPFQSQNNNNSVQIRGYPNINNNNNNNNEPGFLNSLIGRNLYRNNDEVNNNINNNDLNNNRDNNNRDNNNNNVPPSEQSNLFQTLSNGLSNVFASLGNIGNELKNMSDTVITITRTNPILRTVLLDNNPLRIMRNNESYSFNNNNYNNNNNIPYGPVPGGFIQNNRDHRVIIRPPIIIGERGHVLDINNYRNNYLNNHGNNNISSNEVNKIMELLPSTVLSET